MNYSLIPGFARKGSSEDLLPSPTEDYIQIYALDVAQVLQDLMLKIGYNIFHEPTSSFSTRFANPTFTGVGRFLHLFPLNPLFPNPLADVFVHSFYLTCQ